MNYTVPKKSALNCYGDWVCAYKSFARFALDNTLFATLILLVNDKRQINYNENANIWWP